MGATPPKVSTDHFETMHTCSTWSKYVLAVLGLSSYYVLSFFFFFFFFFFTFSTYFFDLVFSRSD